MRAFAALLAIASAGIGAVAADANPPVITAPFFGHFRSVLAQGEGQTITLTDLVANLAAGTVPPSFTSQSPLYDGVMPHAATLTEKDLDTYYKDADFGAMPGGIGTTEQPRLGVQIFRDKQFGVAHIYGATRSDVMFGEGYATAEERMFFMDALRHTAKGTLAELTGPSAASGDGSQLTDQDFSDSEYDAQFNSVPAKFGAEGAQAHQDVLDYIDGINARIQEDLAIPTEMPAEYPALGATLKPWKVSDTIAMSTLLVTQFTVSNGSEEVNALMEDAFRKRFGARWRKPYNDLREAEDPEAFTVAKTPYRSDNTGKLIAARNVPLDAGSFKRRNALIQGPGAQAQAKARKAVPAWVRSVNALRKTLPPVESNAVMVAPKMSKDGHALGAMGPQVGYYSPQIFSEVELHGGGIDVEGVSFPGASPYPLIGHGIDFSWSGTSANGDNADTFAEKLCNANGSAPSRSSTSYMYKGKCIPFITREQSLTTPYSALQGPDVFPQKIVYRTMRSVHGPIFATATSGGRPVALSKAKGVDFHELNALIPFKRLSENQPQNAKQFQQTMGMFPGTENWFYVDDKSVAFQQSGDYPLHARGTNHDLPINGDGSADWQHFNPATYTFDKLPASHRPQALNPPEGFIISWNNKEAPGWRKGPSEWSNGPVHRALILQHKLLAEAKKGGGKVDLTGLTRSVNVSATTDLLADTMYPFMRKLIGHPGGEDEQLLAQLDAWHADGSQRVDTNGDNVDEHSPAIVLLDAWWPLFVTAEFEPTLGKPLFDQMPLGLGVLNWDWASQVQKDLRNVLGRNVRPRPSRVYCGAPSRTAKRSTILARCRGVLRKTLDAAIVAVKKAQGNDPAKWAKHALCPEAKSTCEENEPSTSGAVGTPPSPWQNRGTFHQIVELDGHR